MDFAAEPVMDAFTPPPRTLHSAAADADEGRAFDEHLEAVNEPAPESAGAAHLEARGEAPVETRPSPAADTETSESIDPTIALLGGPLPQAQPIAAPVIVQIAATQPAAPSVPPAEQTPTSAAPTIASQAAQPLAPTLEAAVQSEEPVPVRPAKAKAVAEENKAAPQAATPAQTHAASRSAVAQMNNATPAPTAPQPASAQGPVTVEGLPAALQQTPAPTGARPLQANADETQRVVKVGGENAQMKHAPEAMAKDAPGPTPKSSPTAQTNKATAAPTTAREVAAPTPSIVQDSTQTAQTTTVTATAAQASAHNTAVDNSAQRAAPAASQVAREIIRRFDGGNTSFELRLDPPELGRVEVRMEVSRDHRVTAVIAADSPQALTELARHARELEAQLQSAGLQLSDNGLSFDLRQGAQGSEAQDASTATRDGASSEDASTEQPQTLAARPIGFERWRGVRVDMMV